MLPVGRHSSASGARSHLQHVEGLRALAAGVVLVNHAYGQVWNEGNHEFPPRALSFLTYSLVAGHLSVTVFIVISGFCLTLPIVSSGGELRGGVAAFLKRRARRILPPYYAAVALCLVLIWTIIGKPTGTLWDVPIAIKPSAIVSHLLLLQDLFGTSAINYVFWSIAVEWQIYFLFPAFAKVWRERGPAPVVASALAIGYFLAFACRHTRVARMAPHYIGLFTLGMLAAFVATSPHPAYARARERLASVAWLGAGLLAGVAAAITGMLGWRAALDRFPLIDFFVAAAAAFLLVHTSRPVDASGQRQNIAARVLSFGPLALVGTFSYSVYLVHAPILQILWQYLLRPLGWSPVAMFAFYMGPGLLVILAFAYAFFRMFEEPFMRRSSARGAARAEDAGGQHRQVTPLAR